MEMLTIIREDGSPPVLHVGGELDMATADELRQSLMDALAADPSVVLDLAAVTFVGVAGMRAILEAGGSLNGHGPLVVINGERLERLLASVRLDGTPAIELRNLA